MDNVSCAQKIHVTKPALQQSNPPYAQTEGGGECWGAMVGLWAGSRGGGVSKRGAEVLRIALLALIGDGGVPLAGDKAR